MIDQTARRVRAFYLFTVLWFLRPTDALWILYLLHAGWRLWQVGIAEAGFHIVAFLSDMPTGAFADRYGRRLSMAIGLAIVAANQAAVFLLAPVSVIAGTVAVALGALGWTFVGGADRALLYTIADQSPEGVSSYPRHYGRAMAAGFVASALAAALGGLLAERLGWAWPYGLATLTQLAALVVLRSLPEAAGRSGGASRPSPARVLGQAIAALRRRPALVRLVLFGALVAAGATLNSLYGQSTLLAKGAPVAWVTAIIGGANLFAAAGSAVGSRLGNERLRRPVLRAGASLLAVAVALVGALGLRGSVGAFLAADMASGAVDPAFEATLNRATPEEVRATVLSAPGTGFSLAMVVLFPIAGWLMSQGHRRVAYLAMAVLLGGVALFLVPARFAAAPPTPGHGGLADRPG